MVDTLVPDVSEHNSALNDKVLTWQDWSGFVIIRALDGTYRDVKFAANDKWILSVNARGRLVGYGTYLVWPRSIGWSSWQETLDAYREVLGDRRRSKMFAMIDVESWDGHVSGNHSNALNQLRQAIADLLNAQRPAWQRVTPGIAAYCRSLDRRRVIGYGNIGDLNEIWPNRPADMRVIVANYSTNPAFPGKIAHQFSNHYPVPGLGYVDMSSADGIGPRTLARKLGLWRLSREV